MLKFPGSSQNLNQKNDELNYDGTNLLIDIKRLRQRPKTHDSAFGVTWVVEVKESMKAICERAASLGCVQKGAFRCDYMNYKPAPGTNIGAISVFHHTHYPASTFILGPPVEQGGKQIRAIADRGFDLLLPKFKIGYTPDYSGSYENNGLVFHYRDFRIRVGIASQAKQATKGTIVEIEYLPVTYIRTARSMLVKFAELLLGDPKQRTPRNPPWNGNKDYNSFQVLDIFVQYQTIFMSMRRKVGSVVYN